MKVDIGPMPRVARFEQPVIAVKEVKFQPDSEKKSYMIVHVSFQSTGSTNITTINTLDQVELYVAKRERGRGVTKQIWAIEINEAREFYLNIYQGVDKLDQLLEKWDRVYPTWRWWHAPMQHGNAIGYCLAL
jgi:hypothetical protein